MRYRLMATYRGVPYEAGIGPTDDDVVLFAACPPPEELGFEPATGHWRKQLRFQDVQALWESRPMGTFRGERCIVLDDLGDRLHIAYLGHDAYQAEKLGYWQVDRGVFELVTPRDEVTEIVEERLDYSHRPGGRDSLSAEASDMVPSTAEFATTAAAPPRTATGPYAAAPNLTGPHAMPNLTGPHASGPQPAPNLTGPHATPNLTGPHATPHVTGPYAAGSYAAAPHTAAPQTTGPQAAGPQAGGPVSSEADAASDLAVIPPTSEPPLPLEAAARRAASAAVSARVAPQAPPSPQAAPQARQAVPQARQAAPQTASQTPPQAAPLAPPPQAPPIPHAQRQDPPAAPEPKPESPRRRRSALRKLATQRVFSELAGLAAIPPSAYAVGEEIDGAMCLIQTSDGFEVFNAAAGARHEVRIFDDEESAYFYLFGVLAAEAVRTGRLAPQG
jgi:hypothetical protein